MTLAFLPSYSPQLNPTERFFEEIRKITANRIFKDGIDELSKILEEGTVKLKEDKSAIKSLTAYDWIIEQWEWIFGKVQN
jgi:transposase